MLRFDGSNNLAFALHSHMKAQGLTIWPQGSKVSIEQTPANQTKNTEFGRLLRDIDFEATNAVQNTNNQKPIVEFNSWQAAVYGKTKSFFVRGNSAHGYSKLHFCMSQASHPKLLRSDSNSLRRDSRIINTWYAIMTRAVAGCAAVILLVTPLVLVQTFILDIWIS